MYFFLSKSRQFVSFKEFVYFVLSFLSFFLILPFAGSVVI